MIQERYHFSLYRRQSHGGILQAFRKRVYPLNLYEPFQLTYLINSKATKSYQVNLQSVDI